MKPARLLVGKYKRWILILQPLLVVITVLPFQIALSPDVQYLPFHYCTLYSAQLPECRDRNDAIGSFIFSWNLVAISY